MLIQMSMGISTQLLLLLTTSSPIPIRIPNSAHRRSTTPAFSAAPPRWDSNADPIPKGRPYAFYLDGDDDDRSFVYNVGPNKSKKKRVWWSELDGSEADDDNDEEEEEEFDHATDEEFWGFKVLAAFGWMVPAVGISLLLGTGPNAFLMALAVPLGQRLISLAFDKAVGIAGDASKPRYRPTKTRRKPYPKAKADTRKATEQRRESRSDGERKGYKSWAAADASYRSVGDEGQSRYGGWDDLDHKSRAGKAGVDTSAPRRDGDSDGPFRQQRKSKSRNRVGRGKETPLLMRLLIAAFPFLGFWTRLF